MANQLKVFISSKEGELESERLMVIKAIKSLFLNPVSSEIRSATFRSMKEVNEKEVRSSDIYIGIFGRKYSPPTIQEFSIAKSSMIKRFIFKKYLKESEPRDEQLKQFIKEVEDVEQGTVTEYFLDIFDLKRKVKKAIMEFLSEYYISNDAINVESPSKFTIKEGVVEMDRIAQERKIKELTDEELAKFNFNISNKFRNKIRIDAVTIPNLLKNEYLLINAEVSGTISKGFLDLFIRDSENHDFWFPDEETWDKYRDEGRLNLNQQSKYCNWPFKIPDYARENFRIYMLIFEDSEGNTWDKRKVAAGVEILMNDDV